MPGSVGPSTQVSLLDRVLQRIGPRRAIRLPLAFLFWRGSGSGCTLLRSPHGIVAIIGDEIAGRAPANPRTDGAAHARASPFHTNRTFRETTYGGSSTSAQGSPRHSAGHRARSPCSQSPPSRDSFSHDRVAGLRRATSAKRSSIAMAIYRLLKTAPWSRKRLAASQRLTSRRCTHSASRIATTP